MKKIVTVVLSVCVLLTSSTGVFAGPKKATAGTLACGGNQLIRNGGTEFHQSNYVFRNLNDVSSINIDGIRIYNALGIQIADYPGSALPKFTNGILGSLDSSLDAHQTAQLISRDLFGNAGFAKSERPVQVIIDWSSSAPVTPLKVSLVRLVRERTVTADSLGNTVIKYGSELSRHRSGCNMIGLVR